MRQNYKGEMVLDKNTLLLSSGLFAAIYSDLMTAITATDFDDKSESGKIVLELANRYLIQSQLAKGEADSKRPGQPRKVRVSKPKGRTRKASLEWEDIVYEMVENKRIIQTVFNETNGSAQAAIREIFKERVLPLFTTNSFNTEKNHFGRLENVYKRAKARKLQKVQK